MITLSENQRGFAEMFALFLGIIAAANVPTGLAEPYQTYTRFIIGGAGGLLFLLQKLLQESGTKPHLVFNDINGIIDGFAQLPMSEKIICFKWLESIKDLPTGEPVPDVKT